jgi:hypothetical protein
MSAHRRMPRLTRPKVGVQVVEHRASGSRPFSCRVGSAAIASINTINPGAGGEQRRPLASVRSAQWAVHAPPAREAETLFATFGGFATLCRYRHQGRLAGVVLCHGHHVGARRWASSAAKARTCPYGWP